MSDGEVQDEVTRIVDESFAFGSQVSGSYHYSFDHVVLCGVGQSHAVHQLLHSLCHSSKIPLLLWSSEELPPYLHSRSLVIITSYLGKERELLHLMRSLKRTSARVVLVTSGGSLSALGAEVQAQVIRVPNHYSEAYAFLSLFFALTGFFDHLGLLNINRKHIQQIGLSLNNPLWKHKAVSIASKLHEQFSVVCVPDRYYGVSAVWQYFLEVSAQVPCMTVTFMELPRRSFCGLVTELHSFFALLIHDEFELSDTRKRLTVTKNILEHHSIPRMELVLKGQDHLTKIAIACYLGILTSFALARIASRNPNDRTLQEKYFSDYKRAI